MDTNTVKKLDYILSGYKITYEDKNDLIELIEEYHKEQLALCDVSNCTICNIKINYKGICEMCYTEKKLNDLD